MRIIQFEEKVDNSPVLESLDTLVSSTKVSFCATNFAYQDTNWKMRVRATLLLLAIGRRKESKFKAEVPTD